MQLFVASTEGDESSQLLDLFNCSTDVTRNDLPKKEVDEYWLGPLHLPIESNSHLSNLLSLK